jgi:hypothetical protein
MNVIANLRRSSLLVELEIATTLETAAARNDVHSFPCLTQNLGQ